MARKRLFNLFAATSLAFLLNACNSTQTTLPTVEAPHPRAIPEVPETPETPEITTLVLNDNTFSEQSIVTETDPWKLVEQARTPSNQANKNPLLLAASKAFLNQGHVSTAESVVAQINVETLSTDQAHEYQLTQARLKFLSGDSYVAQQWLKTLSSEPTSKQVSADILSLQADILTSQLQYEQAIEARFLLSDLLTDEAADSNLKKLYALLNQLSKPQLYQLARNVNHPDLAGWVELVEQRRSGQMEDHAWIRWQQRHINHPANPSLFVNHSQTISANTPAHNIALLLPLTSHLGRAAEAFQAGFFDAERATTGQNRSRTYDIGETFDLAPFYYQSAVNNGADFVVGPLGRQAVKVLHSQPNLPVSTLLIGLLPESSPQLNAWGLGLSPEQDAQAIAEKAIQNGLKSAAILSKKNTWGERIASAFSKAFIEKGGIVKAEQRYSSNNQDIANSVKNVLTINDSEIRHNRLEQLLGRGLEHSVRRRDDIDFLFIAASVDDARKLVPLLKFYRAHDLPLFATSSVFSGRFDKISDADLNGLNFVDLPWLLNGLADANENPTSLASNARGNLKYGGSGLDRLYALGYAAYEVIPQMARLQADPWQQFVGTTMSLRLGENRNLHHKNSWAKFTQDGVEVEVYDKGSP